MNTAINAVLIVPLGCYYMIFCEFESSAADRFLTVRQMRSRGVDYGIPLIGHLGIWSDIILLTPLLSFIAYQYGQQWSFEAIMMAAIPALIITMIIARVWVRGGRVVPEALTHDGRMTNAGLWHASYTVAALTVLFLFYFATDLRSAPVATVSWLLAIHVFLGSHIPLSLMRYYSRMHFRWYRWPTYEEFYVWLVLWLIWAFLAWRGLTAP